MMAGNLGYGTLGYDVAHLLGAAVLVLSFVLLYQRRIGAMINSYAVQAWVLTAAAVWQGWVQDAPQLYLTGLLTLAANGLAIPLALHAIVRRLQVHRSIDAAMGVFASMVLGVGMVALSIMVVLPTTLHSGSLTREDLALALSVVLAFMVFGVFFFRLRARFDSLDVAHLDRVGGRHR